MVSACNKVLRSTFLKHDTIGMNPTGGYTCNKYSNKAMKCSLHMEQTDGVVIKHARNRLQYRLPELHHFSEDGSSEQFQ
jgi:hypothetical protein